MKLPPLAALCAAVTLAAASAHARIWTMAKDPAKQFEGDVVKVEGDNVTVKLSNGKVITFKKSMVCEDDRKYLAALPKTKDGEPKQEEKKDPKADETTGEGKKG